MTDKMNNIKTWREILIENSLDAVVAIDRHSRVVDWNNQAEIIFGWSKAEAMGKHLPEMIIPPEFREAHLQGIQHFLKTGMGPILNRRVELMAINSAGNKIPIELSVSPIVEQGETYFYSFIRDISDRKMRDEEREKQKRKIEESEKQLRLIIDASPSFISFVDKTLHYKFANKIYYDVFGISLKDIQGKHVREIIGEESYTRSLPYYLKAFKGEVSQFDNIMVDQWGKSFHTEVQYVPFWEDGEVQGVVIIAHDITERKLEQADQKLFSELSTYLSKTTDEEDMLKKVFDTLDQRIHVSRCWVAEGQDGNSSYNIKLEQSKSLPPLQEAWDLSVFSASARKDWSDGKLVVIEDVSEDSRTKSATARLGKMKIGALISMPLNRGGKLASLFNISCHHRCVWSDREKELVRGVGEMLWSYIENNRLLNDLKDAVAARDEFISVCSHELKTPVTSMKLQYQMAARQFEKNDSRVFDKAVVARRITTSNAQLNRMSKLIEDMLDVSKISSGKLKMDLRPLDMNELVTEALNDFGEQFESLNLSVDFVKSKNSAMIYGDQNRMLQVISNLITNAIKYGGGKPISVSVQQGPENVLLQFTDHGIGIAKENLEKIFQRYERAISSSNISGLGLGLYISHQIVEAHHGKIEVRSQKDHGSTFIVEIPRYEAMMHSLLSETIK